MLSINFVKEKDNGLVLVKKKVILV